jgi:hypothetical protein
MDRRDVSISDPDLDRLLAEALDVAPSPEFRAHVQARVALQRPSRFWPLMHVGVPAAALAAMLVAAVVLWREAPAPAPAEDLLAARSLASAWSALRALPVVAETGASERPSRPAARPRRAARAASPIVLISATEAAALRRLFAGSVGLSIAPDAVDDASAPASPVDIAITPISIDPIVAGSPAEGKQP